MSRSGELVFYHSDRTFEPVSQLSHLVRACGTEECYWVHRALEQDRSWQGYQQSLDLSPTEELVGENVPANKVGLLYRAGLYLRCAIGRCPLLIRIQEAIETHIPDEVRGVFMPGEVYIEVGDHDLIASDEVPEGKLLARAFLSVSFWGYGVATDPFGMRNEVVHLAEVQAVRRELEGIARALQETMIWHF